MPYRVDVVSLDRRGSSARVTLREMKARCVTLDLRAAQDGRWTVARVLDDDSTLLGATLSAYPVVAAAAAPARAVDGRQTCALSLASARDGVGVQAHQRIESAHTAQAVIPC
ncbi:MAG: hypothetical protein EB084_19175, partial [Proteobacteria bacterium]|nr:hypothetical protein [Pseudomonadota bacterium]